ncbi:MAG: ABC-F family ATP-binding cassette domain-containing protein, partial [Candidatus Marinimicrobia bacterium]|nr:ABC-F family ATP-binding cassette domain-containing protein [Candidatus Neomarinimicrobiota bacterium]
MIQLVDISVNFGAQTVFDHCSLAIPPGKHFGLVGQNGSGKSTLLKMIAGISEPNEGQVVVPKSMKVAYLPQEIAYNNAKTLLLEEVLTVFEHIFKLEQEMRSLEARISEDPRVQLMQAYDQLQERFHQLNGYAVEAKAKEILTGLGFKDTDFDRPVSEFSGGWHMRIALAKILLKEPDCLMLDEPTNHLDMETLVWLENLLSAYRGTLIMVSHDRYFLDKLINAVIEVENSKIISYTGNFTDYEIQKEQRIEHELAVIKNQHRKIAHLEQFVDRFRYKASKAKQVQSRIKQLSKIKISDIDTHTAKIKFSFNKPERSGDPVVAAQNLGFAYDVDSIFTDSNFEI